MTNFDIPVSVNVEQKKLSLDKIADNLFIDLLSRIPGYKLRLATKEEDSGLVEIESGPAVDVVAYKDDKHVFTVQLTTASSEEKIAKMKRQMLAKPFVRTSELSDKVPGDPSAVPRFSMRIDNGMMRKFELEPNIDVHPEIKKIIREQIQMNLRYLFTRLTNDLQGRPLKGADLRRAQNTEQYKQVEALKELVSAEF